MAAMTQPDIGRLSDMYLWKLINKRNPEHK